MGKRRNRRHRRQKKQRVWEQFRSHSTWRTVEYEIESEKYKEEQKENLKNIAELKNDLLSRTILVGSVLQLGVEKHKVALRNFLERQYGPVQKIALDKKVKNKQYPRGRVTFNFRCDAEKIFGMSLKEASKKLMQQKIPCESVGYRGTIAVSPAIEYKGMMQDDLNTNTSIQVNTEGFSLGHWFPSENDATTSSCNIADLEDIFNTQSTWVEENTTSMAPILTFSMESAIIELDISKYVVGESVGVLETIMGMASQTQTTFSFRFKDLAYPMKLCRHGGRFHIIFALKHPPRLSSRSTDTFTDWETRTRLTSIGDGSVSFGSCLGYCLQISSAEVHSLLNARLFAKLKKFGLFHCEDPRDAELICKEKVNPNGKAKLETKLAALSDYRFGLHIRSIIDKQSCLWFDVLNNTVEGRDIFYYVQVGEEDLVERVLVDMRDMYGTTRQPARLFKYLYDAGVEVPLPLQLPEFCISLPRILVTPSRVCVTGFEVEMSNRMVRKFVEEMNFSNESFVRVSMGDENGDKLYSDDFSRKIEARIKHLILSGITLNGRRFQFLAFSSSQLKEQSLWMVRPEHGWSVDRIRRSMGDFSMCKSPSKYAARIGQCFSTTIDASLGGVNSQQGILSTGLNIMGLMSKASSKKPRVNDNLPDVTSRTCAIHSDGVGLITEDLLQEVLKQVPFGEKHKKSVSAIQIRYGGAKGVLVAWDFSKLKIRGCQGYDVCLRPSQVKFRAAYNALEVVTIAKAIPYYLNRNVILLGSYHGIDDSSFLELQANHLSNLNKMLTDAECASSFLPQLSGPDGGILSSLCHMLHAGLKPSDDPFLYSTLHAVRSHHLMNLRKKARVHVKDGVVLLGGLDETGLLPEHCIFLQVDTASHGYKVIRGDVMVTKHPVMHPGDMRMLTAVDIPALRRIKNVVLFSQHGSRPEADKMSGSDLDGDQFAITWNKELFLRRTLPPMDYSPPRKADETNTIDDESLLEHFINHARNDNLGRIATLWLDYAVIKQSAGCTQCLELAKLASIAVDFPKSGVPATLPRELVLKKSVPRAHWRERKGLPSFHCKSALGQLYDRVVSEMNAKQNTPQPGCIAMAGRFRDNNGQILHYGNATHLAEAKKQVYNPTLAQCLGWKGDSLDKLLIEFADEQRFLYDSHLHELMNQYRIKSEGELATGCILKYHKLHKRHRHDASEEVRRQFRNIRKLFRSEFFTAVHHLVHNNAAFFDLESHDGEVYDVPDDTLESIESAVTGGSSTAFGVEAIMEMRCLSCKLAASYYITTYNPIWHGQGSRSVLYSFPWMVAADVISFGVGQRCC